MTAAGPWIRVDSGERPGDGEMIIVLLMPDDIEGARYSTRWDAIIDYVNGEPTHLGVYDYWARIIPPVAESGGWEGVT